MVRKLPHLFLLAALFLFLVLPISSGLPHPELFWKSACPKQARGSALCVVKSFLDFPAAFDAYFSDHYRFHQQQVDLYQSLRFNIFHERSFPNVLIGQQDWLYYTGEDNLRDYECNLPFTQDELDTIRQHLQDWHNQLQQRGIRFYVVIAPNKESIYPQYLPEGIQPGIHACRIDQVMSALHSSQLNVLDLREHLRSEAQTAQVYHRTDTHWNALGALIAAREILARIKSDFPLINPPSRGDYHLGFRASSGDLAGFLPWDERFVEQIPVLTPLFTPQASIRDGSQNSIDASTPHSDLPAALIFRDSFCDALIPFLSEHFSRVRYIHSFQIDIELVDQEQPDLVILELAQRYLTTLR